MFLARFLTIGRLTATSQQYWQVSLPVLHLICVLFTSPKQFIEAPYIESRCAKYGCIHTWTAAMNMSDFYQNVGVRAVIVLSYYFIRGLQTLIKSAILRVVFCRVEIDLR